MRGGTSYAANRVLEADTSARHDGLPVSQDQRRPGPLMAESPRRTRAGLVTAHLGPWVECSEGSEGTSWRLGPPANGSALFLELLHLRPASRRARQGNMQKFTQAAGKCGLKRREDRRQGVYDMWRQGRVSREVIEASPEMPDCGALCGTLSWPLLLSKTYRDDKDIVRVRRWT